MRTPISYALAWPDRGAVDTPRLDLAVTGALQFEAPDLQRFPALRLARSALRAGPGRVAALNAANEVAVAAFLQGRIRFLDICRIVEEAMTVLEGGEAGLIAKTPTSFSDVAEVDQAARDAARHIAGSLAAA
jgi:1-deoxy-D-xylulose-5-phosphate reductoisomerase